MTMPEPTLTYDEAFAPYWHPVAYAEEVGEKPVAARLLGRDLVVWRTASGLAATDRYCAHRGADLSRAKVLGERLQCEYHGWEYGRDGACAHIPAQPRAPIPARARIGGYLVQERYHLVWVCLAPEPKLPLPDWSALDAPGVAVAKLPPMEWNISAGRWLENLVDATHLSWVHRDTFGNARHTEVEPYDVQVLPHGIRCEFRYPAVSPAHKGQENPKVDMTGLKYDVQWPFSGRLEFKPTIFFAHTIHLAACPVAEDKMVGFYFASYDKRLTMFPGLFVKQELAIIEEDRVVLERQKSPALPLTFDGEVHLRADRMGVEYRRGLTRIRLGTDTPAPTFEG
ncbi:MAG TPA: aromatic ring-hydroxylating dioxygenase subunit alpha [Myxococcaceae bacterium]|nr:aromatic ring-hydroxylating dioxygenase subunit alpha [Myxococcaceae bacterium]